MNRFRKGERVTIIGKPWKGEEGIIEDDFEPHFNVVHVRVKGEYLMFLKSDVQSKNQIILKRLQHVS